MRARSAGLAAAVAFAGIATAAPASAQSIPPGSYQSQCRAISVQGSFLHAECRSDRGRWATSSLNLPSCRGDIGVDFEGGLTCRGPGVGPGVGPGGPGWGPPPGVLPPSGPYGVTIYNRFGFRGQAMRIGGDMSNLNGTRFNDRVASIQLARRSGPWLVCEDANYRGRCVTIRNDIRDVSRIGMLNRISSLRPLQDGWRPR